MAEVVSVEKDSSTTPNLNNTREQRAARRRISSTGLQAIKDEIEYMKPFELSSGQRLITYERMLLDPDVSTPYNKTKEMVEQAFSTYEIEFNKNSEESKRAADFMEHCIENFNATTSPRSVSGHAFTYAKNKLSIFEKEFDKIESGDFKGYWALTGMYPVSLSTLDTRNPFKIDDGGKILSHARQRKSAFKDNLENSTKNIPNKGTDQFVEINRKKLALFTDSVDPVNPFGISIFDSIYEEWRFKTLVKDILLTGVAKDLSGTPIFYVPSIIMEEAEADPNSWQATFLADLDKQAANLHTGDQTFIRLPSDPHDGSSSMREFEVKFLGVEGSSKAFDLVSILEQSKKAIYAAFGAQNMLTGEQGGGSYNLIEGQNTNHAFTVKRNITIIEEVWNKDIWPQLFRLNLWNLSAKDMPKFRAGNVQDVSYDELGKFMQRTVTSGVFPIVPATMNWFLKQANIPYQFPEDETLEEMLSKLPVMTSNSGEGNGTSGTGTTQSGGSNSDNNNENKA